MSRIVRHRTARGRFVRRLVLPDVSRDARIPLESIATPIRDAAVPLEFVPGGIDTASSIPIEFGGVSTGTQQTWFVANVGRLMVRRGG